MAIRFIRQPSDTPNVTNSDDARMVRYAYGGYDGFVLNRGSELSHTINGNIFKINSGVVVLQGYESELDSNGWELDVGSTSRYYSVYYEVNLATQTAAIKSKYDLSSYPDIPASDDLTQSVNGIAYLLLYQFRVVNNAITDVVKKVKGIPYFGIGYEDGSMVCKFAEFAKGAENKGSLDERIDKKLNASIINQDLSDEYWKITKEGLYSVTAGYNGKSHRFLIEISDLNEDSFGPIIKDELDQSVYAFFLSSNKSIGLMGLESDYSKISIKRVIDYSREE